MLTKIDIKISKGWQTVVVIADTGAGPNIFRLMDVAAATAEFGLAPPEDGLVTADGITLAGLYGSAAVQIHFHGNEKLHA